MAFARILIRTTKKPDPDPTYVLHNKIHILLLSFDIKVNIFDILILYVQ